ncbi:hypothetical protein [Pseudomonas sp. Z13]|uniref:hypothetical protein n=1 Tax=Pseudomonas sp. Z13 TaxID=2983409 RepID=UPI002E81C080|nr:hypothetical protein [Pseudomonas sp. Z13]
MTSKQFAYWLQGFTELNGDTQPTPEQWKSITEHLQTVFVKVTPAYQAPSLGFPGIRTMELRPSDIARPGGAAPLITC